VQPLVTPQALDALAVAAPTVSEQKDMDAAIAIAGVAHGQGLELRPQDGLVRERRSAIALGGAVLRDGPTGPAL